MQCTGNRGFLHLRHQAFVERFVGLRFALENVVFDHFLGHLIGFGFGLIERLAHQGFALARFAVIAFEHVEDFLFFFLDVVINVFQLGLETQHLGEIWTVLRQSIRVIRRGFALLLQQIGQSRITFDLRHCIQIPRLCEFVEGLLPHPLGLGVGELLVDIAQPLGGHVLLVVESPYLILALVGDAGVF